LTYLEETAKVKKDDAEALAELADVYALVNEPRAAKAMFREALFLNPQKVDVRMLDSEMIKLLHDRVEELGYKSPELEEWIPVYGVLFGVFTVKRELRAIELGKLKQSIFSLENEIRDRPGEALLLSPRLINKYFWLIDHYVNSGEEKSRIDETLLKIKVLDPGVYERYVN
jgi:tetratricopeptide (TPR) repeat protein